MSDVVELQRAGRVEQRGAMLAATKTTTVKGEDGKDETLIAGVSRVAAGHWLTTRYPELFVPEPPRGKRRTSARPRRQARTRAAAPKRTPAAEWKPLVRLDTRTAPTFTIRLSERAYLGVTDQAFGQRGTVETGGALFGIPAKDGAPKIRRAGGPGPKARATEGSMSFDVEHIRREALELEQRGGLDRWVGSWHTHPGTLAGHPSQTDLRSFAWDCRRLRDMGRSMDNYIALILTPTWQQDPHTRESYLGWVKSTINAWRMYAVADDQFIVERAEVVRC